MKKTLSLISLLCLLTASMAQSLPSLWIIHPTDTFSRANIVGEGILTHQGAAHDFLFPAVNLPAGTYVEADFSFQADTKNAPLHYVLGAWQSAQFLPIDTLKATMEHPAPGEFATALTTFKLDAPQTDLHLQLAALNAGRSNKRMKQPVAFAHQNNIGAYVHVLGTTAPLDTIRVLCIGNSFTYVYQVPYMLKQLAWSQGHYIDMHAALRGGYTFGDHLRMQGTAEAIEEGHYDVVFLQNQSQTNAWYAQDTAAHRQTLADAEELVRRIRRYSPAARIIIESTWAYPGLDFGGFGSYAAYDSLMERGSELLAERLQAEVSYINRAFAQARVLCPEVNIYGDDLKHQSAYGSYLKACVNYRILFGHSFPIYPVAAEGNLANPNLWFDASAARQLRLAASLSATLAE